MIMKLIIEIISGIFKPLCTLIEPLWMDSVREMKKEYEKDKILQPNDGSDWRRELL